MSPKSPREATSQPTPLDNKMPYPADEIAADLYHAIADAEAVMIRLKMHWLQKDKDITQLSTIATYLLKASMLTRKLEWPLYDSPEL